MKIKLYNKVLKLATMLSIGAFCSCSDIFDEDFLDKNPDERVTPTTLKQVLQLLTSAYGENSYGWLGEISSDNIIDINSPFLATQSEGNEVSVYYHQPAKPLLLSFKVPLTSL